VSSRGKGDALPRLQVLPCRKTADATLFGQASRPLATYSKGQDAVRARNPYKKADSFTLAAKAQGYPARSVFKLEEIDRRTRLLRAGQRVLDLGAAPGSWSKYAAERVGPRGRVLAVDLTEIFAVMPPQVERIQGDVFALPVEELGRAGPYDVVLSDMAPATTGTRFADQARSFDLFMRALDVAEGVIAPGGSFVGKLFMSDDFGRARERLRALFAEVRVLRPDATRRQSYEVFLVGLQRKE
jgi:23S rRNA (uridine2552-2'-O)-methyltransferase